MTKKLRSYRQVLYAFGVTAPIPAGWARELARILGKRGGLARAKKLTPEQRQKIAATAGKASKGKKNGRKKRKKKKSETGNKP